ncbi:MAG: hypothetical protein ABI646_11555 [Acidobacteriota bacterium]
MKAFVVSIFVLFALTASVFAQADIHKVDFKNFTHSVHCLGETPERITVKNGEYSKETQEDGYVDRFYLQVFEVVYGDVNGDGRDDAIVLTVCNTGGTGHFSEGLIYSMRSGKPSLIARIPGGDRAYGGLRSARVEKGLLVVETNDVGEMGGACCPEFVVTTRYKVVGGKLQKSRAATRAPVDAAQRVRFARGASGSTFKTDIGGSESKKFIVGARAGQTLVVSVDRDTATVRLLTAARVTEGVRKFNAVLPKNGDYTFEIFNESTTEEDITVTVRIQ